MPDTRTKNMSVDLCNDHLVVVHFYKQFLFVWLVVGKNILDFLLETAKVLEKTVKKAIGDLINLI